MTFLDSAVYFTLEIHSGVYMSYDHFNIRRRDERHGGAYSRFSTNPVRKSKPPSLRNLIEIIKEPQVAELPWVKSAWLGVRVVLRRSNRKKNKPLASNIVMVLQEKALDALSKNGGKGRLAATWYKANGFPKKGRCFAFELDEVKFI